MIVSFARSNYRDESIAVVAARMDGEAWGSELLKPHPLLHGLYDNTELWIQRRITDLHVHQDIDDETYPETYYPRR